MMSNRPSSIADSSSKLSSSDRERDHDHERDRDHNRDQKRDKERKETGERGWPPRLTNIERLAKGERDVRRMGLI